MNKGVIIAALIVLFCVAKLIGLILNYKNYMQSDEYINMGPLSRHFLQYEKEQDFYCYLSFYIIIIALTILFSLLIFLDSFRSSPVSADEYTHFVERKAYIESYEPESDVEAVALGTEMYELNTWLREKQTEMSTSGKRYLDVPEGFMEETPITIQ
ncbi:MAG: hypothetical protein LUE86_06925 [Clostridiales bacterium]|nr:hypothetical protein [Clostridiales bacterium]